MLKRLPDGRVIYRPERTLFRQRDLGHGEVLVYRTRTLFFRVSMPQGSEWVYKVPPQRFEELEAAQRQRPLQIFEPGNTQRAFWWFEDRLYVDDSAALSEAQVLALVRDKERRDTRRVQRVVAAANAPEVPPHERRRDYIPEDVRHFVMQRAGHRCERCGSVTELQYDHLIPVAMGGSSNVENLQILCGPCNRSKGGNLV